MSSGKELLREVAEATPSEGVFAMWWLGQMGWILKSGNVVLGIDLFLSSHPKRQYEAMLTPEGSTGFDLFLGTHDHKDHIDRESWPGMASASPGARFVLPRRVLPEVQADTGLADERFAPLDDGESVRIGGVTVTAVPAAHEWIDNNPAAGGHRWLGYVIDNGATRVYHSGDTCVWEGMRARLSEWRFAAVMLPINGRDAERYRGGAIGCMTYQEAGDLAAGIGTATVIPCHFDAFARDRVDPLLFADYIDSRYQGTTTTIPERGKRIDIGLN